MQDTSSVRGRTLPKLDRVEHSLYSSERERQLAEADPEATANRLEEITFDFNF